MGMIKILVSLALFFLFGISRAYAQSEVDPDHFEGQPSQHAKPAETRVAHYDGKFKLPYPVQCKGKQLPSGNYSLSLHSTGNVGRVILKQKDQAIEITGVLYLQAHNEGSNVLFVENNGKMRRLSAIHVAELDLVFDPKPQTEKVLDTKAIKIEKVPLT